MRRVQITSHETRPRPRRGIARQPSKGFGTAQYRLALMYRDGRECRAKPAEAIAWFRKAADQGEADAQIELGILLSPGHGGPS